MRLSTGEKAPEFTVIDYFNLTSIKEKPILSVDFLLDETHVISSVHYGRDFGDHMELSQLIGQNN